MKQWQREREERAIAVSGFTQRVIDTLDEPSTFQTRILYQRVVSPLNQCFSVLPYRRRKQNSEKTQ